MQRHYRVTVNGQVFDVAVEDAGPVTESGAARAPGEAARVGARSQSGGIASADADVGSRSQGAAGAMGHARSARSPGAAATADAAGAAGTAGVTEVRAPLPGVVLDVRVREGQAVDVGEVLLALEAMKMENEVAAPCAGTVNQVRVAKGSTVGLGDVLVVLG